MSENNKKSQTREAGDNKVLKKENILLKRTLFNTEQSLKLMESSAEKMERVYHTTLKTLLKQKAELNQKNEQLEAIQNELRLKNEALERSSTIDVLTGAYNRRKITSVLEQETQRCTRYHLELSAILMDLDHFKRVNDTHGHQTGDDVLKQVTLVASNTLREVDVFGRWGGEEFIILCPSTTQQQATQLAERVRTKIECDTMLGNLELTSSFGVASYSEKMQIQDLINHADIALYRAKETRNTVCYYENSICSSS